MKGQYVTFQNTFLWRGYGGRENHNLRNSKNEKRKCKWDQEEEENFPRAVYIEKNKEEQVV